MTATPEKAQAPHKLFDLNVLAELLPCTTKLADLDFKPKGIVLSGGSLDLNHPRLTPIGPFSVYEDGAPHADPAFFDLPDTPILGVCYGLQEIAWRLASDNVIAGTEREYGYADLTPDRHGSHVDRLFEGIDGSIQVPAPRGLRHHRHDPQLPYAAIAHKDKPIFGIQAHPEVSHTPRGIELLKNFAVNICGARQHWSMSSFCEQEILRIRNLVGPNAQVIGAVSGGVDSTVAAKLMTEAIGDRFHAVLVDNGLMRLNECQQVKETLAEHLGISLTVVDASQRFLGALKGIEEPETKRKIIGNLFIDIFEEEAIRIEKEAEHTPNAGKVQWTHHNVGGLPQRMIDGQGLKLIEPLRELFKDEVRELGRQLGVHEDLVMRHPFPGPGIGVRIIGECTPERVEIARQADHIYIEMIREAGLYNEISQAYAGLDTSQAVGVMGDKRYMGYIVILRAVQTTDFMTAEAYPFDMKFLNKVAVRIVNEVQGISLVTYNVTSKPPGTIELQ
ncbi:unnamed protein product [Parascedosporium putredinis]|uniref:GMP synthase [glutamine-hydrolyzing] n=1 Tax=Parascedosporium putredinis TaxID=1442378 RepID=A0A9P1M8Q4_9PEZI|nr:unnamed protein product [Parascedosporium putredinis]CAI7994043.1 unnamed protein product [Parascedosporium putredinis]